MTLHAKEVTEFADDGTSPVGTNEWNDAHISPGNTQSGNYTLVASDAGKTIRVTATATITAAELTAGQWTHILAVTTDTVTIAGVVSRGSLFELAGEHAMATIYCDPVSGNYVLTGDIA